MPTVSKKDTNRTTKRYRLIFMLCLLFGAGSFSLLTEGAQCAQETGGGNGLLEKIIQGSPSNLGTTAGQGQEAGLAEPLLQERTAEYRMLQERHRMILLIAIMVSIPILLAIVLFCLKNAPQCTEESLVNAIGLVLVIEGTMFIAVSAATTEQLTAPIGILGAIAGYLFGSAKRRASEKPPEDGK